MKSEQKKKTFVIPSEANVQWSSTDVISTDVLTLAKNDEKHMGNGVVNNDTEGGGLDQRIAEMSTRLQRLNNHDSDDHIQQKDNHTDGNDDTDGQETYPRQALHMIDGMSLFGVFDGHGGKEVSLFVKKVYAEELLCLESLQRGEYEKALRESFHHIDDMLEDPIYDTVLKQFRKLPNPSDRPAAAAVPPSSSSSSSTSSSRTTQSTSNSDGNGSTNSVLRGLGRRKSPHVSPYSSSLLHNQVGTEGTGTPGTASGTGGAGTGGVATGSSLLTRMRRELKPPGQYTQPGKSSLPPSHPSSSNLYPFFPVLPSITLSYNKPVLLIEC